MSETKYKLSAHPTSAGFTVAKFKRSVGLGIKSLWLHRLRSLLTVLGIVFGVCSVIAMLAIGEGTSFEVQEQLRRMGSSNIILRTVKPPDGDSASRRGGRPSAMEYGLKYTDMKAIRQSIPGVTVVVPARRIPKSVSNLGRQVNADILGTVTWYPEMRQHEVHAGRFFSDAEVDGVSNVCAINREMADFLFPIDNPLGKKVRVGGQYYRVVGVMKAGGPASELANQEGNGSAASEYRMYIPLSAARDRFGETIIDRGSGSFSAETVELHEVTVKVHNQDDVMETGEIIREILKRTHKKTDYEVIVPFKLLQEAKRTQAMMNLVLGAIAAISLIVGGIGIMNIMLASVTERTREIGIRRALGAKKRDIIVQFLIETVILSGSGGLIGVVLGILIPVCISLFSPMVTIITFWSPILAFSISALVGIVFGIYPALRAAEMDPVEALRHE
jgi:putative ABC transport system permease protein